MTQLKKVLMSRDDLTEAEADNMIDEMKDQLFSQLDEGEDSLYFMEEYGLEPDYLEDLLF
ncbi:MAG: hypothetical protein GY853_15915 [PVC group bacterium]|nr:hypothetical protein [PVC group bacterium]